MVFFSKSAVVFINFSQRTCSVQISEPRRKKFDRKGSLKIPKNSKRFNCLQNFDFWNCLYGDVECRFHNPAWKTSTEKVPLKIPKIKEWFNSLKFFFLQIFLWTCRTQFRHNFCQKNIARRPNRFRSMHKTMKGTYNFTPVFFFLKTLLSTLWKQFREPSWKVFDRRPKILRSVTAKDKKIFPFSNLFSPQKLIRTRSMQFWKSSREEIAWNAGTIRSMSRVY